MFSVCVCFGDPCAQICFWIERLFWEIFVLIGSLVELYVGLHSYLCFSHLEKLFWKAVSTPPQHFLNTLLFVKLLKHFFKTQSRHLLDTWWIDQESSYFLDSSSTPARSIEFPFLNLTLYCLIASSIPQLSKTRSSTASSIPPDASAVENYWRVYIFLNRNSSLISLISLDLSATVHLPNTLHFTPNLFLKDSSSFLKFLLTW